MLQLDWTIHINDTLADLQDAVQQGDDALANDIADEARSIGATEQQIKQARAGGVQLARSRAA